MENNKINNPTIATFRKVVEEMIKLYIDKNHDYNGSFEKSLNRFGLLPLQLRLSEKLDRLESLITKDVKVKTESVRDTIMDIATYCGIAITWIDNKEKE